MSDVFLTTKSVKEIIGGQYEFFIPDYQRGYRWGEREVEDLLNDIDEFANNPKGFYCLQPLVLLQRPQEQGGNICEVIDGQQRLTTLFLILWKIGRSEQPAFKIRYERHQETHDDGLAGLLVKIESERSKNPSKPDLYYIQKACKTIDKWLENSKQHNLYKLGQEGGPDIRFIWYQIPEDGAISAFIRLNAGKIPLTPAELVRALFLRSDVLNDSEQLKLAAEWDHMERRFQEPEFWGFLATREYIPENRIELLFRQAANVNKDTENKRAIFDYYIHELNDQDKNEDPSTSVRLTIE